MGVEAQVETSDVPVPCPVCGRRICDVQGRDQGDLSLEIWCPSCRCFVWLTANYLKLHLEEARKDRA